MPTRVLLWDQREIILAGIKSICCQQEHLQIVGETSEQESAIALTQIHCPDVVIVELSLIQGSAKHVFEHLLAADPRQKTKILVLAEVNSLDAAIKMTQAGASGYLTHHCSLEKLIVAIHQIAKGHVLNNPLHGTVLKPKSRLGGSPSLLVDSSSNRHLNLASVSPALTNAQDQVDLSVREREVLSLIAQGMTNKQAAEAISLSVKTVETYRSRIMKKHDLKDRLALFRFAASIEAKQNRQHEYC